MYNPTANNGLTHRSTKRKSRKQSQKMSKHSNRRDGTEHQHNKSLVLGSTVDPSAHPMTIYLNEIVSNNSNNIIVVSNDKDMKQVKNSLESGNGVFMAVSNPPDEVKYSSPKTTKHANAKPSYLISKQSIIDKKPDPLIQSYENDIDTSFGLKLPEVGVPSELNINTVKNMDKSKKNFNKFEIPNIGHFQSKMLPSINTKKSLRGPQSKRVPKNRDLSMTVIKTGRLALQDEQIQSQDIKKNTSMSREPVKKKTQLQFPLNRKEAWVALEEYLYEYEQLEILDYDKIYFFPLNDRKSKKLQAPEGEHNYGFDNQNGDYRFFINDHVAYRYEIIRELGKGSFGVWLRAFDHLKKEFVALKILRNRKKLHKQGLIEISLIETLNKHDPQDKKNIVQLRESFKFRDHICITFELLSINLYEFIKNNDFRGVSLRLTKRFAIQILVSLLFMYEHSIIHCDLKPENILLRNINKSGIKIIDFGSGCLENQRVYTYIQSRFYRAPEIILGIAYTCAIDMWSFGCILFELYTGYPLFAGEDEQEQLQCIMEVKGVPPKSLLVAASRTRMFFDEEYNPKIIANSRGKTRMPDTKDLYKIISWDDPDFVDFIDKCTEWKTSDRLTPSDALMHPWIKQGIQEIARAREERERESKQDD